jgi:hypothetical protein
MSDLANIIKQNEGMEQSFAIKNIKYTKLSVDDVMEPEAQLHVLKTYNEYLKGISKENRPAPQQKEVKEVKKEVEVDDEELFKEVTPVYSSITNMEDIKRSFFSYKYDVFTELVMQHPFKYYTATYKYASYNNGKPAYIAKNLLRGFTQGLDNSRKYLMVCIRCILTNKDTNEYEYPSYWILNSNDSLETILGPFYHDYEFVNVQEDSVPKLLKDMEKTETYNDTIIGEAYVH